MTDDELRAAATEPPQFVRLPYDGRYVRASSIKSVYGRHLIHGEKHYKPHTDVLLAYGAFVTVDGKEMAYDMYPEWRVDQACRDMQHLVDAIGGSYGRSPRVRKRKPRRPKAKAAAAAPPTASE